FKVVNWNIEWFGGSLGPTDNTLQENNVRSILQAINADIYSLGEIVSVPALARIVSAMPGYAYIVGDFCSASTNATGCANDQKLAFVYKTATVQRLNHHGVMRVGASTNASYNWSNGRFPLLMEANITNNGFSQKVYFIGLHAKANTADHITSYNRRLGAAQELRDTLLLRYPTNNWIVLGDYNDDLDRTITTQVAPNTNSSYLPFLNESSFVPVTLPLSLQGVRSTVGYPDIIDHVTISNEMNRFYVPSSATVLRSLVESLVPNYGTTTSDHFPVMTEFQLSTDLPATAFAFPSPSESIKEKKGMEVDYTLRGDRIAFQIQQVNQPVYAQLFDLSGKQLESIYSTPVNGQSQFEISLKKTSSSIVVVGIQHGQEKKSIKIPRP
ncbi:MAG: endonuclease/exonuclease/phosphatase family protein, partial [Chitinophagaceae bacterium]